MATSEVKLHWQLYRLFAYERDLALREIRALLRPSKLSSSAANVVVRTRANSITIQRLTYFSKAEVSGSTIETTQALVERSAFARSNGTTRKQATRYSVHGMHEYKGKFNPQVARAILNILGSKLGDRVLDPFCGSGTTLVECAHAGLRSVGCDLNPLATYVAKSKFLALGVPGMTIRVLAERIVADARGVRRAPPERDDARRSYLAHWFPPETLERLETLRCAIFKRAPKIEPLFLTVASDLLRDYSLQEPQDLRIRRRKSPLPEADLFDAYLDRCRKLAASLEAARPAIPRRLPECRILLADATSLPDHPEAACIGPFDAAVTSPPYATALPYIDTQRLSLVWLELVAPSEIPGLQATLIGSREFCGRQRTDWQGRMEANVDVIPPSLHRLCTYMSRSLGPTDGFRRRAVPSLLYRYCVGMRAALQSVATVLRRGAPFALIVGHNHTAIGGRRFDIDTPSLLEALARQTELIVDERVPLQTYQRYGLHQKNAIAREELLILRKP